VTAAAVSGSPIIVIPLVRKSSPATALNRLASVAQTLASGDMDGMKNGISLNSLLIRSLKSAKIRQRLRVQANTDDL
jgi:hypothetical protein